MEASYKEIESVSFTSDIKNISVAESLVDAVCKNNSVHEDHYGNILIAVTEAVNNAIQHGNLEDHNKKVLISVKQNSDELCFTVKDAGQGFAFDNLPDPTAPENIEKESGRGIFLMKSLADKVTFEENGAKVILTFGRI
ncbi:ATP-binding protein [Brumimicrobium glaciale]|jgi:serine/threonine-protein kinase RsbW|uniref:ATP-binding protein n=1 Tax=Brumimicrobium glaciale TaxID=200475 RepID=A0A4V1WFR6_9FLAO|nr:ATP-binding protein [Brumimicrobium glaciale]RYM34126.1 ATP-binding protein [Brumimicrobium glaciale]